MEKIILADKEITVRKLAPGDLKSVGKFAEHINSLVKEGAYIHAYKKISEKEERNWLEARFKKQKQKRGIFLVAEHKGKVIGIARVESYEGSWDHQAELNIDIAKDFRGIGLGSHLIKELIKRAIGDINPRPVRLILGAMTENKDAIRLYKKEGFKKIAIIPGQHHYKDRFIDEIIMVFNLSK